MEWCDVGSGCQVMAQSQQAAKTQLLASLPDLLQTTDNEIITPAILAVNDIDEEAYVLA